jgi:hypothetical protein
MYRQTPSFSQTLLWSGILASATAIATAQTSPTTLMQINGNAASDNLNCSYGTPCDYWNLLNGSGRPLNSDGTGSGSSAGHSSVRTFLDGTASTDSFTGGGSKDPADISQWKWSGTPTPNKDTLNSGYAAAYTAPNSSFHLMFGADRVSPSGDANIGIWFFQNTVKLNPDGSFSGLHKNGDIFIISSFTGGGGTSNIQILQWSTSCKSGVTKPTAGQCADSNLLLLAVQASTVACTNSPYCATTNALTTNSLWQGPIASPLFFQGGINLSYAVNGFDGGALPCFSSFLEETRSSQSTSAVLKDFLLGGFPVCSLTITKQCDTANPPVLVNNGTQVLYSWKGVVHNTGVGTLSGIVIDDNLPTGTLTHPTLLDSATNSPTTTLAPGATGTYTATATVASLTAKNTASAKGFFGTSEIDAPAASDTCTAPISGSVGVVKHCVAPGPGLSCSGSGCVVQVPVKATVCNLGKVRLTNITLVDNPAANLTPSSISTLDPAGTVDANNHPTDCANVTGSYQPTAFDAASNGLTDGRFTFSDLISVTAATPALGGPIPPAGGLCPTGALACAPVSCPLCSAGECTTSSLP